MKKQLWLLAVLWGLLTGCEHAALREMRLVSGKSPDLRAQVEERGFRWGAHAFIRIFKKENMLEVWLEKDHGEYALYKEYPICIYSGSLGPKLRQGDKQAPEGFYQVGQRALNPKSQYRLSFNLGFPNAYDKAHGYTGSYLMVHGDCVSVGCYAMGNRIDDIYILVASALQHGQPSVAVHAFPFRLTDANLAAYNKNQWHDFWQMLKPGYDYFEHTHRPPAIEVIHGKYRLAVQQARKNTLQLSRH